MKEKIENQIVIDETLLKQQMGANIALNRKLADVTQEILSEKLGLTVNQLSRIENGHSQTSICNIYKIAAFLNCDIHNILPVISKECSGIEIPQALLIQLSTVSERKRAIAYKLLEVYLQSEAAL